MTEYEDSMIAKNFAFAFINSYASFFYIGWCFDIIRHLFSYVVFSIFEYDPILDFFIIISLILCV